MKCVAFSQHRAVKGACQATQSRTDGTFGAILFVLLFVPARSKPGTMTVRLPLFCLTSFRRDYARSRPEPSAAAARKVICSRVRLANWPENPPVANSGSGIYDRDTVSKLGRRGFGLGGTS